MWLERQFSTVVKGKGVGARLPWFVLPAHRYSGGNDLTCLIGLVVRFQYLNKNKELGRVPSAAYVLTPHAIAEKEHGE